MHAKKAGPRGNIANFRDPRWHLAQAAPSAGPIVLDELWISARLEVRRGGTCRRYGVDVARQIPASIPSPLVWSCPREFGGRTARTVIAFQ